MIKLDFPSSELAGQNKGGWYNRHKLIKSHRLYAHALAARINWDIPEEGDIQIGILFIPLNDRGDRTNYPIRVKPYLDGLADGMGVNDKRFLPTFHFAPPCKKTGCVQMWIDAAPAPELVIASRPWSLK